VLRVVGISLLLALLLMQMALSSARKSAAFDETYHLVSGYAYLRTGDPRLSWEHPPLAQVLAALPLLARDDMAPFPFERPAWQAGDGEAFVDDYLWVDNAIRAPDLIWAGRWPLMGLTLLFGLALFLAVRSTLGEPAAWLGLALFVLDPNVVAGGRLISNDMAVAGLMFVAVWRLGTFVRRPTWPHLIAAGLAAGLAVATKVSAVVLAPIFLLVMLIYRPPGGCPLSVGRRILALIPVALVAALAVWAVFGFQVGPLKEGGVLVPAPTLLEGLPRMWQRVNRGTPTYLLGRVSDTGWWYYFPLIFLLKTPLPTLSLLIIGAVRVARRPRETALYWVPALLYLGVASISTLQIGYRYILPVLFFCLPVAGAATMGWRRSTAIRVALVSLLGVTALEATLIFPDHMSYVNQLGGGPDEGWRILADMNVDWGQDLVALRQVVETQDVDDLRLAYFGSAYPSAYGVTGRLLPSFSRLLVGPEVAGFNATTPPPGTYAISATSLHLGLVYRGQDLYAFFRDRTPDARAGRSILIYHLSYPPATPVDRVVVIGPEVWSLPPEELGWVEGHRLIAKWAGSDAFVLAGQGPARYVVRTTAPDVDLVDRVLAAGPVFDARPYLEVAWEGAPPLTPDREAVPWPAPFGDGLALGGWTLRSATVAPGGEVSLTTMWEVEGPLTPPLSVFVHVLGPDGLPVTQWDGWPVATDGLEVGDVVILSHPMAVPTTLEGGEYVLQVGLYRPPHGPRFLTAGGADRLLLTPLTVAP
jgi:hypothetical protein